MVDLRDPGGCERWPAGEPMRGMRGEHVEVRRPGRPQSGERAEVARRRRVRVVGSERGELEEEREPRVDRVIDEFRALGGEHVSEVVGRLVTVVVQGSVLVERVVELGVAETRHVPFVEAGRLVGQGKAGRDRALLQVAVEVLAHHRRDIARTLELDRERLALLAAQVEQAEPAVGAEVLHDLRVVREVAGEDRRPRGAAQRVRDEVIRERHPLLLQRRHVRHVSQEVHREVVGEHEHDVRPLRRRLGRRRLLAASAATAQHPHRRQHQPGDHHHGDHQVAEPESPWTRASPLRRPSAQAGRYLAGSERA